MIINKIKVKTKTKKYLILIGPNIIKNISSIFSNQKMSFEKCLVVVDKNIPKKFKLNLLKKLKLKKLLIHKFNASEKNKNYKNVDKIHKILLKNRFNREDCLISFGGGIVGDVVGFASSTYKRGIKFINIPTTLLAQVDSSIGGKTGINSKEGKNLVGSFYQPNLVLSDSNFLKTLPKREIVCGYAEILKHSLISDKKFFLFLNKNALKILKLKSPFIEKSIYKSCLIKKKIVQKDEKEKNLRKVLNFGHTFAHAYEAALGYSKKLNHGEAVLLGISSAIKFSFKNKFLNRKEYLFISNHIKKYKLPHNINNYFSSNKIKKILEFMTKDKKNNSQKINLILLKNIGHPIINKSYNKNIISNFFKKKLFN